MVSENPYHLPASDQAANAVPKLTGSITVIPPEGLEAQNDGVRIFITMYAIFAAIVLFVTVSVTALAQL